MYIVLCPICGGRSLPYQTWEEANGVGRQHEIDVHGGLSTVSIVEVPGPTMATRGRGFRALCLTCGWKSDCVDYWEAVGAAQEHNFNKHSLFGSVSLVVCDKAGVIPDAEPGFDLPEGRPEYAPEPTKGETMCYMNIDEIKHCCKIKGLVPAQVPGLNFYQFMYEWRVDRPDPRGRFLKKISWKKFEEALISKGIGVWGRNCWMKIRKV